MELQLTTLFGFTRRMVVIVTEGREPTGSARPLGLQPIVLKRFSD
jgi:hypothetical protein